MPISPRTRAQQAQVTPPPPSLPTDHSISPPTCHWREKTLGRPRDSQEDWAPMFLQALMEGQSVTGACRTLGMDITTPYYRRKRDPDFKSAWQEAVDIGTKSLEHEAARRAYHGVSEAVYYRGEQCGSVTRYSDLLLIFLLKARKPEMYRDQHEQGKGAGSKVNVVVQANIAAVDLLNKMIDDPRLSDLSLPEVASPTPTISSPTDTTNGDTPIPISLREGDDPCSPNGAAPDLSGAPGDGGHEWEVDASSTPTCDQFSTGEDVAET